MTEVELLIDFHKSAKRQGPGSTEATLKALSFIGGNHKKTPLKVADIGCGTGAQTICLAENITGEITAVDLYSDFLEILKTNSKEQGLDTKISPLKADMEALPFHKDEFDIIWSEGAIYIMGFEKGIQEWKKYLKPDGFLAVSEITWLTESRPKELEEFWNSEYPEIDTASGKIRLLEKNGYSPVGYFTLPEYCWVDNYYQPMQKRISDFLENHPHSKMAERIVNMHNAEIEIYNTYKHYYSYGFFIAQKVT